MIKEYFVDPRLKELGRNPDPSDSRETQAIFDYCLQKYGFSHPIFGFIRDDYTASFCYHGQCAGLISKEFEGRRRDEAWLVPVDGFGTNYFAKGVERVVGVTRPMSTSDAEEQRRLFFEFFLGRMKKEFGHLRTASFAYAGLFLLYFSQSLAADYYATTHNDVVSGVVVGGGMFLTLVLRDLGQHLRGAKNAPNIESNCIEPSFVMFKVPKVDLEYVVRDIV